jgi:hypothetical protein
MGFGKCESDDILWQKQWINVETLKYYLILRTTSLILRHSDLEILSKSQVVFPMVAYVGGEYNRAVGRPASHAVDRITTPAGNKKD